MRKYTVLWITIRIFLQTHVDFLVINYNKWRQQYVTGSLQRFFSISGQGVSYKIGWFFIYIFFFLQRFFFERYYIFVWRIVCQPDKPAWPVSETNSFGISYKMKTYLKTHNLGVIAQKKKETKKKKKIYLFLSTIIYLYVFICF